MLYYMRTLILSTFLVAFAQLSFGQNSDIDQWYGFWVGDWSLTWEDSNGGVGKGENRIERILDGKVIQENFSVKEGQLSGFSGKSMSVYNPQRREWRQAWVDNQGGYYDFVGRKDGERYFFETKVISTPKGDFQQRMVFYDITDNSLIWDWEATQDGGKTWSLNWRIHYQRKGSH